MCRLIYFNKEGEKEALWCESLVQCLWFFKAGGEEEIQNECFAIQAPIELWWEVSFLSKIFSVSAFEREIMYRGLFFSFLNGLQNKSKFDVLLDTA